MEKFEELEKICDFLKEQCHHEDCKDVYRCPETHPECRAGLDLYTALVWELSIAIQRFGFSTNFEYHRQVRRDFNTLRYVLNCHYKKYKKVCDLLNQASQIMLKIIMDEKDLEDLEDCMYD